MGVKAHCYVCNGDYPLGSRTGTETGGTTACPECGSIPYSTFNDGVGSGKSDFELLEQAIDVKGVGRQTRENIHEEYTLFTELRDVELDELTLIDGIGRGNGERILEKVEQMVGAS